MGVELLEIGVKVRKGVIFTVRGCFRSVCNHPFFVVMLCFLIFLYRSSPFIFQLLVSASPILVCTAVLLGTLLSFGQSNIPEIEIEEKTTVEAVSIKTGVLGDATVVEKNESHYVERFSESRWDEAEKSTELPELLAGKLGEIRREENSDDTAPLIEERSRESELSNGENRGANRELGDLKFKEKTEWIEERHNNGGVGENHDYSSAKLNSELESDDEKSEADSFDSEKVNVDSLDSPPRSPWARVEEREDEEAESQKEQDDDEDEEASDSGSDCAESSSPDASMADIMPMLDELHPLLDQDAHHTVHLSRGSSDAASDKSLKSSASNHQSDNESENHEDLEVADDENEDGEDEEDAQEDKTKSAISWTEEDEKNLMDLGSSEIERNQRLENLILRRRARKTTNLFAERNLIDLDSSDLPFNIAPISTRRQNPFDLPHDYDDNSLPPIPGSAPSVLVQRRNPFDIPYDSSEEKPDLKGDVFQEEFTSQSREPIFRRHESFDLGPSIFAPKKQDVKMRPYFVPEGTVLEESSSSLFRRQSSELSDSKVSSIPETESVTSVEDLEDKKFPERASLPETEVVERTKEPTEEHPSGVVPELISRQEVGTEEDVHREEVEAEENVHQEPKMITNMENVYELIAHGSQSSEEEDTLELGQVENRDVQVGEFESQLEDVTNHFGQGSTNQDVEGQAFGYGSNFEDVEPRYTRVSSSSSLSEVSERVFIDTEGEELSMLEGRTDDGADEPSISTRTSLGSTDLNITSVLVNNISHMAPVYDSSPRELSKNVSSSSVCSDVLPESDRSLSPVLDKLTVSSIGRESEGISRETDTVIPRNIEMLLDSSTSHPVASESWPVDIVDIREHDNVDTNFSEVDPKSESSLAAGSFALDMSNSLVSSGEALMEEQLMEKHILDEVSVSMADKNIQTVVRSSKDQDLEQAEDKHLLLSERHGLTEASETQLEGLQREHSNAIDETVSSSEDEIQHETEEKSTSMLLAEGNTSLFYDNAIQEPDFNYLNEVQASSTPVESLLDGQITWDLNMSDVQELDRYINSPSSPKFVSSLPSAIVTNTSTVDVQTVIEEVDEIKEIDDGLLSELDNVGDFSVGQIAFGTSEFDKHADSVGEESLSSTHRAEVKKIEHLLHLEESKGHIDVYERDVEQFSEPQTYQTSVAEHTEVSREEFDENYHGSSYQDTAGVETTVKENEVLPGHSLVNPKHEDTVSGIPNVEVGSIENVDVFAEKAELVSVETEVMVGVSEVSCQGQVDTISTSGMPEHKASSIEDIDLAFMQTSSKDIENHFVLDSPQSKLQNHEDTVSTIPESEVLSIGDVDAVPKKPESTPVETEFVVGVSEVSCQGQFDTDTTSGMTGLEASAVEGLNLAFEQFSSEEIEKPLVLESVYTDTSSQISGLEASKTKDIDLTSQQISSTEIEKHAVLEPQAEPHNYEDTDSELPEQEVHLTEDVHPIPKFTEMTSVETEIIIDGADVSSQGQVNTDTSFETTEIEASTADLEPVDKDTSYGMPEIEASSIEAIDLAFKHAGSEEIKNHGFLEPLQTELVVGETITDNSEDRTPHGDASVPVSTTETSVLEVGPSKDVIVDDKQLMGSSTGIDELHDSVDITENSENVVLHGERSVMASTNVTPVAEVGLDKDAILDDNKLTDSITGADTLHESVSCTLPFVESGEEQGASSELHVAEAVPSEDTTLPPNQVLDVETPEQLKLKLDDESVEVKASDKIVLSEEKSSVKGSSAFEAEKSNHEDGAPKDLHSPSSVKGKGKGKISRSSSSSSSSSSDSSSSDSDRE